MITTQEIQENVLSQVAGSEMNENDEPPSGLSLTNLLSDNPLYFNNFIETNRSLNHLSGAFIKTSFSYFLFDITFDTLWQDCFTISVPDFFSFNNQLQSPDAMISSRAYHSLYILYQVCTPDGNQLIPRQPDY
ncbi:MAG: hypothetical protein GX587_16485 [Bacteroidales bacterium]|nr:hypothetical protein [Bacteroidales bacterium]